MGFRERECLSGRESGNTRLQLFGAKACQFARHGVSASVRRFSYRQLDLKVIDEPGQLSISVDDAAPGRREISRFLDENRRVL